MLSPAADRGRAVRGARPLDALIDAPFDAAWVAAAEHTWQRMARMPSMREVEEGQRDPALKPRITAANDRGYIAAIAHPFFEEVAKQVLRTDRVCISESGIQKRPPAASSDQDILWEGCHIDWQITESDFEATPRRDQCCIWLWLDDVLAERAAMRILPGSHRQIMRHWERVLLPEHKRWTPRHHPLLVKPTADSPTYPEHIPEPADCPYTTLEPTPVLAQKGQAMVFTQ